MAQPGLANIMRFYTDAISVGVSSYESGRSRLVLPVVPFPLLRELCTAASRIFADEPTVLEAAGDFVVVGDLHGHILDLFRILQTFGFPPTARYLFLGDFVDRGEFSTETAILILVLKVLYPKSVLLVRGNHEFREMWDSHRFVDELESLYPKKNAADEFAKAFAFMPLAAVVNGANLCVHGGIGPSFSEVSQIAQITRPIESFEDPILLDLLWSDPSRAVSTFAPSPRGIGHIYGEAALAAFLAASGLTTLVRGHETITTGQATALGGRVVTVFSASSYCNSMANSAGVLLLRKSGGAVSRILPPLRYLMRTSAAFLSSEMDGRLLIDARKVAVARTPESSVLPTLERVERSPPREVPVMSTTLPKMTAKKDVRSLPSASPRGMQGGWKMMGFEGNPARRRLREL
jgi:protein phosphatase